MKPAGKRIQVEHVSKGWTWKLFAQNGKELESSKDSFEHRYNCIWDGNEHYPDTAIYLKMHDTGEFYLIDI